MFYFFEPTEHRKEKKNTLRVNKTHTSKWKCRFVTVLNHISLSHKYQDFLGANNTIFLPLSSKSLLFYMHRTTVTVFIVLSHVKIKIVLFSYKSSILSTYFSFLRVFTKIYLEERKKNFSSSLLSFFLPIYWTLLRKAISMR